MGAVCPPPRISFLFAICSTTITIYNLSSERIQPWNSGLPCTAPTCRSALLLFSYPRIHLTVRRECPHPWHPSCWMHLSRGVLAGGPHKSYQDDRMTSHAVAGAPEGCFTVWWSAHHLSSPHSMWDTEAATSRSGSHPHQKRQWRTRQVLTTVGKSSSSRDRPILVKAGVGKRNNGTT